ILRPSTDVINEWVGYGLLAFEQEILASCRKSGTTVASIEFSRLKDFVLPVPPVVEQTKIVEILEEQLARLDAAVKSVQTVREKATQFRRSLLHAAFTGAITRHQSGLKPEGPPDGWDVKVLSEVGRWGSGGTPKATNSSYYGGSIPWAVIGDLNDELVTETSNHITELGLSESSAKLVEPGTILIAMYGSIGKLGIAGVSMATNQAIAFVKSDESIVRRDYLFHFLGSQREAFTSSGKGMTQQNISQTILKSWPIPVAPLSEQEEIVEILEEQLARLDAGLTVADEVERKATALRRSLLHAAFSGELTRTWREANV
ncbi:hypothetical protein EBT31_16925, partial [bacterium]|nr:hypothetical protein [bacterium]